MVSEGVRPGRTASRDRILAVLVVVLLAGTLVGGGLALAGWRRAESQQRQASAEQRVAIARGLTLQAESLRGNQPVTALRLGVAAMEISPEAHVRNGLEATLAGPRRVASLTDRAGATLSVAFGPDGRTLATASRDDANALARSDLWDISSRTTPRRTAVLTGYEESVLHVAFGADGATLATVSPNQTQWWDVTDLTKPRPTTNLVTRAGDTVAFSPDGRTLATTGEMFGRSPQERDMYGTVLWDITSRDTPPRSTFLPSTGDVTAVAFSHDGRTVAIGSDGDTSKLWDISDRKRPRSTAAFGRTAVVRGVAFSPDDHTLATASSDYPVTLWDLTDRKTPRRAASVTGPGNMASLVAFSPDGRTLATANNGDSLTTVWEVTNRNSPRYVASLPGPDGANGVNTMAFSPDGRTLATANENGTTVLWDMSPFSNITTDPVGEACRTAHGGLTPEEWKTYIPQLPYRRTCRT